MIDLDAIEPERSARYSRIAYLAGIALGVLSGYLAATLTYKTIIHAFADGRPDVVTTETLAHGSAARGALLVAGPILISLAFAVLSELALRGGRRWLVSAALALAAVAVVGTFVLMFSYGVVYTVPWAMALAGSIVLTMQALDERAKSAA